MKITLSAVLLLIAGALSAQQPQQQFSQSPDQLRDFAKQAQSSGDLESVANYFCQAAAQDKKYGKRCEKAREDAAKALDEFKADLNMGREELERKDYVAALRDLGKITFGPLKREAQGLILQDRLESGTLSPVQVSQLALAEASAAYAHGDFGTAEGWLKRVQAPAFQAAAGQLQANINAYRNTMNQADTLARSGDFKGAAQKYQFAATIRPNGPGEPLEHLRQVLDAQEKVDLKNAQQPPAQPAPPQQAHALADDKPAPVNTDSAEKIKSKLAVARRQEAKGDVNGALQGYDAVLKLDNKQPDALAGRKRLLEQMRGNENALAESLNEGITEFYASHLTKANEIIGNYLQQGGREHVGAAHFYLGATLLSQALLTDPKDKTGADALRRQGQEQLALARQSHYVPLDSVVSPKILVLWAQAGE
jgi:hypothetical protein